MTDIFELVNNRTEIISFLEGETGTRVHKAGSSYRLNPCPLCYHNDCFTIYPETNSFDCYSCQKAGDIVSFVRLYKKLEDNLSAAKFLADKYGISSDDNIDLDKRKKKAPKKDNEKTKSELSIDDTRANDVRKIVAAFYHNELLSDKKALEYQTIERGHSIDVLKQFLIGYASKKSIIKNAVAHGYTVDDLIAVGIARKVGKGYKATVPEGSFIYPQIVKGDVVYFSLKIPGKKFQIKKVFADPDWLCFNQDTLKSKGPIFIVEGANDFLSVIDKAKQHNVIATLGNFNTTNILNYLKTHSKGNTFYLCFDNDDAGQKYEEKYTNAILASSGLVRIITIPAPHKDIDEFLCASKAPENDFTSLIENAKEINQKKDKATSDNNGDDYTGSYVTRFKDFEVLGELADKRIAFWSKVKRKIYITSLKDFNLDTLDQIGTEEVRYSVVRSSRELTEGKIHFFALKRDIIIEAGKKLLGEEHWLGQGVNLLEDGRLLIVNGDLVLIWNGSSFDEYQSPIIERKFINRDPAYKWIDFEKLQKTVLGLDKKQAANIYHELLNHIRQWHFMSENDDALVTGFLIAQRIQTLWNWRSHMWINGGAGSGKTSLLVFAGKIGGRLSSIYEGQVLTEPGFRQDLKNDFKLNFIDEFERTDSRSEIIDLLRSAGRGGSSTKGTSSGRAIRYYIRHSVMIASIERGYARAAERHRFISIEMEKDASRNPIIPDNKEAEELNIKVTALALFACFQTKDLIKNIGRIGNYERRMVEAYAAPLSMMSILESEPLEFLRFFTEKILDEREDYGDGSLPSDEQTILDDILSSTVRISMPEDKDSNKSVYGERNVLWLLNSSTELHQQDLATYGIWKIRDGIFFHCETISRKLLRDTKWKDLNISSILKRHANAEHVRVKKDHKFYRGIKFDNDICLLRKEDEQISSEQASIFR